MRNRAALRQNVYECCFFFFFFSPLWLRPPRHLQPHPHTPTTPLPTRLYTASTRHPVPRMYHVFIFESPH